jgi:hypothetical protein
MHGRLSGWGRIEMSTHQTRRRSDRLSPRDQVLKERLLRGAWTHAELEWLQQADPRLPLLLASIIKGKLRALEAEDLTTHA